MTTPSVRITVLSAALTAALVVGVTAWFAFAASTPSSAQSNDRPHERISVVAEIGERRALDAAREDSGLQLPTPRNAPSDLRLAIVSVHPGPASVSEVNTHRLILDFYRGEPRRLQELANYYGLRLQVIAFGVPMSIDPSSRPLGASGPYKLFSLSPSDPAIRANKHYLIGAENSFEVTAWFVGAPGDDLPGTNELMPLLRSLSGE